MAKASASDSIRKNVNAHLKEARQSHTVTDLKTLTTAQNTRFLKAAAAFDRATRDKNFKPSDEQAKDYIRLTDAVAKAAGIEKNKGFYDDKRLESVLSPKNLMNVCAAQLINGEIAKVDKNDTEGRQQAEAKARENISQALAEGDVYGSEQIPEEAAAVKNVTLNQAGFADKTDVEFLAMDKDEQDKYLASLNDYERERLQELLTSRDEERRKQQEKNAGRIDPRMGDPDFGHKKDDDNFKIEQGDIIEYLMKDIILASAAWAGNKTAGVAGIILYESGAAVGSKIKEGGKRAWEWSKEKKEKWGKTIEKLFGHDENGDEQTETKKSILQSIIDKQTGYVEESEERVKQLSQKDKKIDAIQKLERQLCKHYVILDEDGVTHPYIEDKDFKTPLYIEYYKTFSPDKPEEFKQGLKTLQKNLDEYQIAVMEEQLKHDPKISSEDVRQWFTAYTQNFENEGVRQNNPNPKIPDDLNKPEFLNAYEHAQQAALLRLQYQPRICILNEQAIQFNQNYALYQYLELARRGPDNPMFQDEEKALAFFNEKQQEANLIFLKNERAILEDNPNAVSREELINMSKNMVKLSQEAIDKGSDKQVEDQIKQKVTPPQTEEEKKTLAEFSQNRSMEEFLQGELNNSNLRIRELEAAKMDNDTRRNEINKVKERQGLIKRKDPSTKDIKMKDFKTKEIN